MQVLEELPLEVGKARMSKLFEDPKGGVARQVLADRNGPSHSPWRNMMFLMTGPVPPVEGGGRRAAELVEDLQELPASAVARSGKGAE